MKKIILILILASFSATLAQFDTTEVTETYGMDRKVIDLSGKWKVSNDEGDTWSSQHVPSTSYDNSTLIYKKTIKLAKRDLANRTYHLEVNGISDNGEFYVNNQFLGSYFGGMTQFWVDLPENSLKVGDNEIKIKVNPTEGYARQIQQLPIHATRAASGIIRNISLVSTAGAWVSGINASYKLADGNGSTSLKINGTITTGQNTSIKGNITVKTYLKSKEGQYEIGTSTMNVGNSRVYNYEAKGVVNYPKLWSPDEPNLYSLVVKVIKGGSVIDQNEIKIGFKDVTIVSSENGNGFLLNGKPFKIKSVNYIDDIKGQGQSLSNSQYEKDIREIKKLGANTIRVKFGVPHPYLVDLCDRYGLFILYELPVYNTPTSILNSDEIKVRIKNIADRILTTIDNSPSVFSYGLYSYSSEGQNQTKSYTEDILTIINKYTSNLVHKTIYSGSDYPNIKGFDFLIYNFKHKTFDFNKQLVRLKELQQNSGSLPIVCEIGTTVQKQNKNGYADKLSLEFQAYYLLNSYSVFKSANLAGYTIDTYNDYLLEQPTMINNSDDKYVYTSGLVDRERNERAAFKAVKSIFNKEKEPLLTAGSDPSGDQTIVFIITGIVFGLIFLMMINRFKRFREYFFRSILRPYNFYADIRDQRLISAIQTSVLALLVSVSTASFIAATFYYLRFNDTLEYFLNVVLPIQIIKENLFTMIWSPALLIIIMALIMGLYILIIAALLRVAAFVLSVRLFFKDAFTLATWALIPTLLLLPVSAFMIKIFEQMENGYLLIFLILVVVKVWSALRLFKSSAVVFDKPKGKVYLTEFVIILIFIGIPLLIMQLDRSIVDYVLYIYSVMV
jgi:beta-galactosidase